MAAQWSTGEESKQLIPCVFDMVHGCSIIRRVGQWLLNSRFFIWSSWQHGIYKHILLILELSCFSKYRIELWMQRERESPRGSKTLNFCTIDSQHLIHVSMQEWPSYNMCVAHTHEPNSMCQIRVKGWEVSKEASQRLIRKMNVWSGHWNIIRPFKHQILLMRIRPFCPNKHSWKAKFH